MPQESYTNGNRHVRRRPDQVNRTSAPPQSQRPASSRMQNTQKTNPSSKNHMAPPAYRFTSGRSSNPDHMQPGRTQQGTGRFASSGRAQPVRKPEQMRPRTGGRNGTYRPKNTSIDQPRALTPRQEQKLRRAEIKEREWQKDIVRVKGGVDKIMLGLILVLVCLGTVMVFSASYPSAMAEGKDMLYYGKRQIIFVCLGLFFMLITSMIPYRFYRHPLIAKLIYGVTLVLLVIVLIFGVSEGEAKRWLNLKIFSIQPSEIMKFSLIIILAWYVETYKKQIDSNLDKKGTFMYHVFYPGVLIALACGLVLLEKHLSGTIIIFFIGWFVILIGGCKFRWTFPIYGGAGILAASVFLFFNRYALKRITTYFDEDANILGEAYQTAQGLYAIGSGGLFGVGLGESRQKYSYVSAAHTDFIFSIWCEEFGFIGGVFLVLLYLAFVWRGYVIAARAPDTFSCLVAFGITTHVGLQAILNMCVVTKIMFNTGISLPFFSYGGTSLVVLLAEMGVLLSISRQYYMKEKDLIAKQTRQEMGLE